MLSIGCAYAQTDNARLTDTISIAVDITNTVGYLNCRHAAIKHTHGTQNYICARCHTAITVDMGSRSNARSVRAMGIIAVIGSQRVYLVTHENRARQFEYLIIQCFVASSRLRVIDPNDTCLCRVSI